MKSAGTAVPPRPIRRLLIANRGEIALRILRSCQRLGIDSVLAASDADLDSLAARRAGQVLRIGPPPAARSYLRVDALIEAAQRAGADALHPGYGFLSENPRLAQACHDAGLIFVGPEAELLRRLGDKLLAREAAQAAGLPVLPGAAVADLEAARALAGQLGFPLLVKAVGGGGGRGMQVLRSAAALDASLALAAAEAGAAFGDARLYLERFVEHGRHVEVQLLGDGASLIHLGTRDCSLQRRYQKVLEEAPAPALPDTLRQAIEASAVTFGRALAYRGAGTVEFLVDVERQSFHFLEMNARIQVEHPVTEAITGLDLVAEQLRLAEGRRLRLRQEEIVFSGHAIECRLNAEDWRQDFQPSPGQLRLARYPAGAGLRVDSHLEAGDSLPPWYDSLLAKLIVHGRDRNEALARLRQALAACRLEGVATNLGLHQAIAANPAFVRGGVASTFLPRLLREAAAAPSGAPHG